MSIESHLYGTPIIRPLIYQFQNDVNTDTTSFEFMLGPFLLVASVIESNATERTLYLPDNQGLWCDIWTGKWYECSKTITVSVPLEQHGAVFAQQGSMIPMMNVMRYIGAIPDKTRIVWLFPRMSLVLFKAPNKDHVSEWIWYEDDGESLHAPLTQIKLVMKSTSNSVHVELTILEHGFPLPYDFVSFKLPVNDDRLLPEPICVK